MIPSLHDLRAFVDDVRKHDSVFWRRAISFGANRGSDAFVRYTPPLFGLAFAAALPEKRRRVRDNLRLALGDRSTLLEHLDVARVFTTYASCLTEAFLAVGERGDALESSCTHEERFVVAASEGHGVILATAHTGGWQQAGQILKMRQNADVIVVMGRERDARAQQLQDMVRDKSGVRIAHIGDDPLDALPLLAHLRRKGVVAVQVDRLPPGLRGRDVELFGKPWRVPEGPLQLAAVSRAPIVPVFTRRLGFMRYEVEVAPPIHVPRRPSPEDLDRAARALTREMEKFVVANATQWFHFE